MSSLRGLEQANHGPLLFLVLIIATRKKPSLDRMMVEPGLKSISNGNQFCGTP